MLMVAPTGSMNLVTLESTPAFSSRHWIVTGRAAELDTEGKKEEREKGEEGKTRK